MLGTDDAAICSSERTEHECLCTNTSATPAVIASRRFRSFRIRSSTTCPKCGGPVHKLHVVARDSVQGHRLVHHRLRARRTRRRPAKTDGGTASRQRRDRQDGKAESRETGQDARRPTGRHGDGKEPADRRPREHASTSGQCHDGGRIRQTTKASALAGGRLADRAIDEILARTFPARSGRRSAK